MDNSSDVFTTLIIVVVSYIVNGQPNSINSIINTKCINTKSMSIKGLKVIDLKVVTDYKLLLIENLSASLYKLAWQYYSHYIMLQSCIQPLLT